MSDLPDRVPRAFRRHDSFEETDDRTFESTTGHFDATVEAEPAADGRVRYTVTVRVPMLNEVVADHVAEVVENGWYETFELRVADVGGGVTRGDHDLDPDVARVDGEAVVTASFEELDPNRAADDAAALITFVEGTFVQGIIPGYEYTSPVTEMRSKARRTADGER